MQNLVSTFKCFSKMIFFPPASRFALTLASQMASEKADSPDLSRGSLGNCSGLPRSIDFHACPRFTGSGVCAAAISSSQWLSSRLRKGAWQFPWRTTINRHDSVSST